MLIVHIIQPHCLELWAGLWNVTSWLHSAWLPTHTSPLTHSHNSNLVFVHLPLCIQSNYGFTAQFPTVNTLTPENFPFVLVALFWLSEWSPRMSILADTPESLDVKEAAATTIYSEQEPGIDANWQYPASSLTSNKGYSYWYARKRCFEKQVFIVATL